MRFWLTITFLFSLATFSGAQSWKELNEEMIIYYNSGNIEKALETGQKAVATARVEFGETHPEYATSLNNLALVWRKAKQPLKAVPLYEQANAVLLNALGAQHNSYIVGLNQLAGLYRDVGEYGKAETTLLRLQAIVKGKSGDTHLDYSTVIYNLGGLYLQLKRYAEAERLFSDALSIRQNVLGPKSDRVAAVLHDLAWLYEKQFRYADARPLFELAKKIRFEEQGEDHPDHIESLFHLALVCRELGLYNDAVSYYTELVSLRAYTDGETETSYAISLQNLAGVHRLRSDFETADSLYLLSAAIIEENEGKRSALYASTRNNQGALYMDMGKWEASESAYQEARKILEDIGGGEGETYASTLNNLGVLYQETGRFDRAEPLMEDAAALRLRLFGAAHPEYAASLNNLGTLYLGFGFFDRAEANFLEALRIQWAIDSSGSPSVATYLNNLGDLFTATNWLEEANRMMRSSLEITANLFGEQSSHYGIRLNNLAMIHFKAGDYDQAAGLFKQALEIIEKTLGREHSAWSNALNNLARSYELSGRMEEAGRHFQLAVELNYQRFGDQHPNYALAVNNLALFYIHQGDHTKALSLLPFNSLLVARHIASVFNTLSENEKNLYLERNISLLDINNSFIYSYPQHATALAGNNFNLQLLFKSMTLDETRSVIAAIRAAGDSSLLRLYEEWKMKKGWLGSGELSDSMARRLEPEVEAMEKELTRGSAAFREQRDRERLDYKSLQPAMGEDEAIVEFVRFSLFDFGTSSFTDSVIYGAYVLKKNGDPVFVPLFEQHRLRDLYDSAGSTVSDRVNNFYRGLGLKNKEQLNVDRSLYEILWQPLEPLLQDARNIYYSPAGELYGVAFHALRREDGKMLMETYRLRQLGNSRRLLAMKSVKKAAATKAVIFADPAFGRVDGDGGWSVLPGTRAEAQALGKQFETAGIKVDAFLGIEATEDRFRSLDGRSPRILHVATHGFFQPGSSSVSVDALLGNQSPSLHSNPLFRSGLVLAGANERGNADLLSGKGYLNAYEISQFDLSNTELVVLSACETALGDVKGSEGVFGLQRAFRMSGVERMIVSLWQVPDKETAELMTAFYSLYLSGASIPDAFAGAQEQMRKKYPPFFWAAFVLVE